MISLLKNIIAELPALEKLLEECNNQWVYEEMIYRFYQQSFKVYRLQKYTQEIVVEWTPILRQPVKQFLIEKATAQILLAVRIPVRNADAFDYTLLR